MMIFKTIDGIFKTTRYGVWTLALFSIPCSIVLMICNFSNGFASIITCFAALLFSIAIMLVLLPKTFVKTEFIESKRFYIGITLILVALLIVGFAFFTRGAFPKLNMIFI